MPQNDFLPIATEGDNINVISQIAYAGSPEQLNGFSVGQVPPSGMFNKMVRQSASVMAMVTAFLVAATGLPLIDNGDATTQLEVMQAAFRIKLQGNTSFFIATTGSDVNGDGSNGNPWQTAQHAVNVLQASYDLAGFVATIQREDGAYTDTVLVSGLLTGQAGAAGLVFSGNLVTPANVTVTIAAGIIYAAANGAQFTVQGQKLKSTAGAFSACLSAVNSSGIQFNTIDFDACSNTTTHIVATGLSYLAPLGIASYTISGGAGFHIQLGGGSQFAVGPAQTITLANTPAFGQAFCLSSGGSMANFASSNAGPATFGGTGATGKKFNCLNGGGIFSGTSGGGVNYLPGDLAGTTASNGYYN